MSHELFEDDGSNKKPVATPAPQPAPAATPAPVVSGTTAYTFGTTNPAAPPVGTPVQAAPDETFVNAVNDGVFGGEDTHYVHFMKVYETLGRPSDPGVVMKVMQTMDSTATPSSILADISTHLMRLDGVIQKANSDFDSVAKTKLGGADQTLAQLQQANDTATAEIARHQKETTERMGKIAEVTQQRAADEASIAHAKAQTEAAENAVKQQLQSMQALFNGLAQSH